MKTTRSWKHEAAIMVGVALVYYIGANLAFFISSSGEIASPLWPPAGIAIAALLALGTRYWPGVAAGAFIETLLHLQEPGGVSFGVLLASLAIAAGNTTGAVSAAVLAKRFAAGRFAFEQPQNVLNFVGLAAAPAAVLSSGIGCLSLAALRLRACDFDTWFTWLLGDFIGAVVVAPILLVWLCKPLPKPERTVVLEFAALAFSVMLAAEALFGGRIPNTTGAPIAFLITPVMLWPALRFGRRGTALAMALLSAVALAGTAAGRGPFASSDGGSHMLLLQAFLGVLSVLVFVVAADTAQRKAAQDALRDSEQRYRGLFENNPQPALVYDPETLMLLAANRAALHQYGYSEAEVPGLDLSGIGVTDDVQARAGSHSQPIQAKHRTKEGTLLEVELRVHEVVLNRRPAVMLLATDVTERNRLARRAQAFSQLGDRLGASQTPTEAARAVLEAANVLFAWDAFVFDMMLPDQKHLITILALDTINGERKEVAITTSEPGTVGKAAIEYGPQLILRADLEHFPKGTLPFGDENRPSASVMMVPIRNEVKLVGLISVQSYTPRAYTEEDLQTLVDLAEHCSSALDRIRAENEVKRLNQELRAHLEELQIIFNVAPVGIAVCRGADGKRITGNAACEAMFGPPQETLANGEPGGPRAFRILRNGMEVPPSETPLHIAAKSGKPVPGEEFEIAYADGRSMHCYASASPLYTDSGAVRGSRG